MKEFYRKHKWIFVTLFCFALFIYYFIWSAVKPYDYAPDEYARFPMIYYLFENGKLPSGWLSEIRNQWWGFSYAFYITWLPSLLSALCMKIVSLFTMSAKAILVAARFPNVVASVFTSFFVFKSLDKLLTNERVKWFVFICVSTTPQFAFLASYINNDALALLGSSMICYAWVYILKKELNIRISVLLGFGISIVTLSYYNAYGWILLSMVLFITLVWNTKKAENKEKNNLWICGLIVTVIVLGLCGFFLVRNTIMYEGDVFGLKTLEKSSEMYAVDTLKPSLRQTPHNMGESITHMVFLRPWIVDTFKSSVGFFGYMMFQCSMKFYIVYAIIDVLGYLFFLINTATKRANLKENIKGIFFRYMIIIAALIPVLLSIHYSYYTDYQPQGRYIYPAFPAVAVMFGLGYEALYKLLKEKVKVSEKFLKPAVIALAIGMMIVSLYIFKKVYLPSAWGSMQDFVYVFPVFNL